MKMNIETNAIPNNTTNIKDNLLGNELIMLILRWNLMKLKT